jgi:hypothetical protein
MEYASTIDALAKIITPFEKPSINYDINVCQLEIFLPRDKQIQILALFKRSLPKWELNKLGYINLIKN